MRIGIIASAFVVTLLASSVEAQMLPAADPAARRAPASDHGQTAVSGMINFDCVEVTGQLFQVCSWGLAFSGRF